MTAKQIDELCDALFSLKYRSSSDWEFDVISKENRSAVKETIIKYINDFVSTNQGELEAKVYVYEKIIANSNFAPMLQEKRADNV